MLAPVVYVVAVLIGGILRPRYSQISRFVSELLEAGAPNKALLNPLFALYNLFTIAFGIGLYRRVQSRSEPRGRVSGSLGALVLVAEGLSGLLTVFFPQYPRGTPVTSVGIIHIVLAGLISAEIALAAGFFSRSLRPRTSSDVPVARAGLH